jgi:DNA-binding MarR family transcriptional regulator
MPGGLGDGRPRKDEVLSELLALAPSLDRLVGEGLRRRDLTMPRARLLLALDDAGPVIMNELSKRLEVTPRAVTALVDGLAARDLVRRCDVAADRRATLVELTAAGRRVCRDMRAGHRRLAEELLSGASARELDATLAVLRGFRAGLEHRRAGAA